MSTDDPENHSALYGVMDSGKAYSGFPGTWEPFHESWLGKSYSRKRPSHLGGPVHPAVSSSRAPTAAPG